MLNKAAIDKDASSDFSRVSRETLRQISRCERRALEKHLARVLVWMKSLLITANLARDRVLVCYICDY